MNRRTDPLLDAAFILEKNLGPLVPTLDRHWWGVRAFSDEALPSLFEVVTTIPGEEWPDEAIAEQVLAKSVAFRDQVTGVGLTHTDWTYSQENVDKIVQAQLETGRVHLPSLIGYPPSRDKGRLLRRSTLLMTFGGDVANVVRYQDDPEAFSPEVTGGAALVRLRHLLEVVRSGL